MAGRGSSWALALLLVVGAVGAAVWWGVASRAPVTIWVFAHPDDEVISAGGAMHRERGTGDHVVLLLTDGEATGVATALQLTPDEVAAARRREARAALAVAGIHDVRFAGLPDGGLTSEDATRAVREVVGSARGPVRLRGHSPEDAYDPYGRCGHPDHCAAAQAVVSLAAEVDGLALFRIGHFFGAERDGTCRQLAPSELEVKQEMRQEYMLRRPEEGRLGIAWLSVPGPWEATETEPECTDDVGGA
jgi:LmbE family N-acetylglucosaminyl deacetylase